MEGFDFKMSKVHSKKMYNTNFDQWALHYKTLLSEKYHEFCTLFPKGQQPSYAEFINFVWTNTTKTMNHYTGKVEAKMN